jgi:hypothetical protein
MPLAARTAAGLASAAIAPLLAGLEEQRAS